MIIDRCSLQILLLRSIDKANGNRVFVVCLFSHSLSHDLFMSCMIKLISKFLIEFVRVTV